MAGEYNTSSGGSGQTGAESGLILRTAQGAGAGGSEFCRSSGIFLLSKVGSFIWLRTGPVMLGYRLSTISKPIAVGTIHVVEGDQNAPSVISNCEHGVGGAG